MSNEKCVAVVGATGAVGEVLLDVLAERDFPVGELRLLASERSAGRRLAWRGREIEVQEVAPERFDGADFVFFAATGGLSKTLAPEVAKRGGVAIDKSSTWRMHDDVPLVVPEINPEALDKHKGIVACPNCTTIGVVMALEPLRREAGLRSVVITTLQAASGAGREGVEELEAQLVAQKEGGEVVTGVFAKPLARNVVPMCDAFDEQDYTKEEWKLVRETRKILEDADLGVSTTCVRVPVPVGHAASILVETVEPISPDRAREVMAAFPGVEVVDDPAHDVFPTPQDVVGRDAVLVGRVRKDLGTDRLWVFQVADNLRKGAATNAVQTAEAMIQRGLK